SPGRCSPMTPRLTLVALPVAGLLAGFPGPGPARTQDVTTTRSAVVQEGDRGRDDARPESPEAVVHRLSAERDRLRRALEVERAARFEVEARLAELSQAIPTARRRDRGEDQAPGEQIDRR